MKTEKVSTFLYINLFSDFSATILSSTLTKSSQCQPIDKIAFLKTHKTASR